MSLPILYYFEYLRSTKTISLLIKLNASDDIRNFDIKLVSKESKRCLNCTLGSNTISIHIGEIPICTKTPSIQMVEPNYWRILFRIDDHAAKLDFNEFVETLPSSDDLESLYCKECSLSLIQDSIKFDILSLPGDNWHEMKDIWVCACTTEMLNSSDTVSSGVIRGLQGKILTSCDHLLLHGENVKTKNLIINENTKLISKKQEWFSVQCCRCRAFVGRSEIMNNRTVTNVKLYKHAISSSIARKNAFSYHSLETYASSLLLQSMSNHHGYRFVFCNLKKKSILYVTVLNWNVLHIANCPTSPYTHPFPCIKVLFTESKTKIEKYQNENDVYELLLCEEECYDIVGLLTLRHLNLPTSQNKVLDLKCSYMYYVPLEEEF